MASGSCTVADVQFALLRAKRKICELQQQIHETPSEDTSLTSWTPSKELRDSLVDIYKNNVGINEELRRRLHSPVRQQLSSANQHLPEVSPFSQRQSSSPVSPRSHRFLSVVSPLLNRRSVSPLSGRAAGAGGGMESEFSHSRGASPRVDSNEDAPEATAPSPAPRRYLLNVVDSVNATRHVNEDHNISLLLKELDNLRLTNSTLQEQLVMKEKELQGREVEEELREELQKVQHWERPTAVLDEVLAAQKERDRALMSRLLLANKERDEALLRVRHLHQAVETDSSFPDSGEQDMDGLLHRVCEADSVHEIRHVGSTLVQGLRLAWQRRNDITAQEMNAVMEERDTCMAKCKRLEELMQNIEQQPSQEQLLNVQRDRDRALEDRRRLEAELQALRSTQILQDLTLPPQSSLDTPPKGAPLLVELQQLSLEKQRMEAELRRCREAEQDAAEKVHRLERLVEVLRKKVGSGRLRPVI